MNMSAITAEPYGVKVGLYCHDNHDRDQFNRNYPGQVHWPASAINPPKDELYLRMRDGHFFS
ncbi:hypothetical protein OUZ56_004719 [Daphnia magna]|uniref:Uncharacterized protein n=1 Tax=Daphnia magna TaxID=35525 RepID=A0ABQ9YQN6_9CRUS|nr:hypothetical protein OUZ56_004719 [Daphnia magna]